MLLPVARIINERRFLFEMLFPVAGGQRFCIAEIVKLGHPRTLISPAHPSENRKKGRAGQTEGSAKNPPKGKFVRGVFYVTAEAATHKAT
jgi:hypothetical protein